MKDNSQSALMHLEVHLSAMRMKHKAT